MDVGFYVFFWQGTHLTDLYLVRERETVAVAVAAPWSTWERIYSACFKSSYIIAEL
jgi:hypothetical protein